MPLVHFVDNELIKEMEKIPKSDKEENEALEEHNFIASCLKIGLRIDDLKQFSYKDIAKIIPDTTKLLIVDSFLAFK